MNADRLLALVHRRMELAANPALAHRTLAEHARAHGRIYRRPTS